MDVDDPESAPASPEAEESSEQIWSPSQNQNGDQSGEEDMFGDNDSIGSLHNRDANSADQQGSPRSSNPGTPGGSPNPQSSPQKAQLARAADARSEPQSDSGPASPDNEAGHDFAAASDVASDDNFDLEETPDEKEDRLARQKLEKQKGTGKSGIQQREGGENECDKVTPSKSESNNKTVPTKEPSVDAAVDETDVLNTSKTSLHDDHGELDYDEEIHDETTETDARRVEAADEEGEEAQEEKAPEPPRRIKLKKSKWRKEKKEVEDSKDKPASESEPEEGEATEDGKNEGDEGEVDDDDDCEEGEIKEPGNKKPFVSPVCRFYNRGNCTWGTSCRFLHPGVNDKGNYTLLERPERVGLGVFSRLGLPPRNGSWNQGERGVDGELPAPSSSPPAESAWERGLRQAKELMKRANKRKETETNFEEKRLNLSLDEDRENNKENDRGRVVKDPYYDNVYEDEDDGYYNKGQQASPPIVINNWHGGHYENFEVRWSNREQPDYRPPHLRTPPYEHERLRERLQRERRFSPSPEHRRYEKRRVERSDRYENKYEKTYDRGMPAYDRPLPYIREQRPERSDRLDRPERSERSKRTERSDRPDRPDRLDRLPMSNEPGRFDREEEGPPQRGVRGDEWHDPWSRANKAPLRPRRSPSRSRSRGRQRRRSFSRGSRGSSSSSYSSSSYSSRSRSSSYSSGSSRSSRSSSSSSRSRSRSRSRNRRQRVPGPMNVREPKIQINLKPGEAPKSMVTVKPGSRGGQPGRGPPTGRGPPPGGLSVPPGSGGMDGRTPGGGRGPSSRGGPPGAQHGPAPPSRQSGPPPPNTQRGPPPGGPDKKIPPGVKQGPPGERGRAREREPPGRGIPKRASYSGSSSGSSRSYSSSSGSRSGSASSVSSLSSSSSSSSSGSADSEHLYRDIGTGHNAGAGGPTSPTKSAKKATPTKKKSKKDGPQPAGGPPRPGGPMPTQDRRRVTTRDKPLKGAGMPDKYGRDVPQRLDSRGRGDVREVQDRREVRDMREVRDTRDVREVRDGRNVVDGRGMADPGARHKRQDSARRDRERMSQVQATALNAQSNKQDPLKVQGQKSNIKLTLINKSDKNVALKKRPAQDGGPGAPPAKRPAPAKAAPAKEPKPASKPAPVTSAKPEKAKAPVPKPKTDEKAAMPTKRPAESVPAKVAPPAAPAAPAVAAPVTAPAASAAKAKKSASSRREELLKQLKAVEDAIARKRAKMS